MKNILWLDVGLISCSGLICIYNDVCFQGHFGSQTNCWPLSADASRILNGKADANTKTTDHWKPRKTCGSLGSISLEFQGICEAHWFKGTKAPPKNLLPPQVQSPLDGGGSWATSCGFRGVNGKRC